jgi:tyrosyl-tRNA synthetase
MRSGALEHLLGRGVHGVISRRALEEKLARGKKLRVKLGIDPTAPDLHLGHAVALRKLREFQDLGHKAVLIIGDFTAQIGDPSGKSKTRPPLTEREVKKNMKAYLAEAGKVIYVKRAEIRWNSEWHAKGGLHALLALARAVTVDQVLEREDFKKRRAAGEGVSVLEALYPLLQGYDSVAVQADVELGGTDQTFNLLMGRRVQRAFGMKEQDILTVPLLEGLDGARKMSKSLGNYIGLADNPRDMYGKAMSLPDKLMAKYFELCTDVPRVTAAAHIKKNPRGAKARLAFEIVKFYYGEAKARRAEEDFVKVFLKKETDGHAEVFAPRAARAFAFEVVGATGAVKSKSEAWRLIEQGGFSVSGEKITDPKAKIELKNGDVLKVGKRRFFRVKL